MEKNKLLERKNMDVNKIDFSQLEWEEAVPNVRYKRYEHTKGVVRLLELGKDYDDDWCRKGHIGYVVEGEMDLVYVDRRESYKPGDVFIIEEGEDQKHKAVVLTEKVTMFLAEDE